MKASLTVLVALVGFVAMLPQVASVRHDDPCGTNGDAADTWPGAKALSALALAGGCTTESIAAANSCGAAVDSSDWFFVDTPVAAANKQIRVTLRFLFGFCGAATIDSNLRVYFVPGGAVLPTSLYTSQDGNGPGVKLCESNNAGVAQEQVTCSLLPSGLGGTGGRYYVQKVRVAGSGANSLQVAFV